MPNGYEWVLMVISAISLLLSFLNFRDRRSKEQTDNVSDHIATLHTKQQTQEIKLAVLEERVDHELQILDNINCKIDRIIKESK
jgi:hypothetical protein